MDPSNLNGFPNKTEVDKKPEYPKEFFDLQVDFAKKLAELMGISVDEALLEYTNLYGRFNLGRDCDAANPVWQEFIAFIQEGDTAEKTYQFYLKRKDVKAEKKIKKEKFGCFACEYSPEEECVYVHFGNDKKDGSPLDDANLEKRMEEAKRMFEYIKTNFPGAKKVRGNSWLYNLSKYRRLYPPEYTRDPKPNMSLKSFTELSSWGQFLNHEMKITPERMDIFKKRIAEAKSLDEAMDSFPLRPLKVETDIHYFYNFYGIK